MARCARRVVQTCSSQWSELFKVRRNCWMLKVEKIYFFLFFIRSLHIHISPRSPLKQRHHSPRITIQKLRPRYLFCCWSRSFKNSYVSTLRKVRGVSCSCHSSRIYLMAAIALPSFSITVFGKIHSLTILFRHYRSPPNTPHLKTKHEHTHTHNDQIFFRRKTYQRMIDYGYRELAAQCFFQTAQSRQFFF